MNSTILKVITICLFLNTNLYAQTPPPPPDDLPPLNSSKDKSDMFKLTEKELENAMLNSYTSDEDKIYTKNGLKIFGKQSYYKLRAATINNKLGFVNYMDSLVIPAVFDIPKEKLDQNFFIGSKNLAIFSKNGKFGCLDIYNNEIIPFKYDKIEWNFSYRIASKADDYDIYDDFGNVVFSNEFQELKNLLIKINDTPSLVYLFKKENRYGVVDYLGNTLIKNKYDNLEFITNSKLSGQFLTFEKGKSKIIDLKEKVVVESKDSIVQNFGNFWGIKINNKFGLINTKGNLVLEPIYDSIYIWDYLQEKEDSPKLRIVVNKKIGQYDCVTERVIISPTYENIWSIGAEHFLGILNNGYFLLKNSKRLNTNAQKEISRLTDANIAYDENNIKDVFLFKNYQNKMGIYSGKLDSLIVPQIYDGFKGVTESLFITQNSGRFGILNDKNEIIIPNKYTNISKLSNTIKSFFIVENDSKKGLVNNKGDILLPVEFDRIELIGSSSVKFEKENKFGIIYVDFLNGKYNVKTEMINEDISWTKGTNGEDNYIINGKANKIIRNKFVEIKN